MNRIKRSIAYFDKHHPHDLGASEADRFLTHLADNGTVEFRAGRTYGL
jgi:hypothetical protein